MAPGTASLAFVMMRLRRGSSAGGSRALAAGECDRCRSGDVNYSLQEEGATESDALSNEFLHLACFRDSN